MAREENYWTRQLRRPVSRRSVLRGAALTGLGVVGASVIGCSTGGSTTAPASGAASQPTAAAASGQLRIASSNLYGQDFLPGVANSRIYQDALYDYQVGASPDGKLDPARGFANSWEMSPDGKTWTFKLRNDVVFHNGDKATSKDIKATFLFNQREGSRTYGAPETKKAIDAIDTPDDSTIIFRLNAPDIFFATSWMSAVGLGALGYLLPGDYVNAKGPEGFAKAPIGSGPYKLKENNIGQNIVFEAVDKHWYYGVARYKRLEFQNVPEATTRMALLTSGKVELGEVTRAQVPDLKKAGFNVFIKEGGNMACIFPLNQWRPGNPLGDAKVRKAMDLALDRQTIVDTFLKGAATPSLNYPIMSWDAAYEKIPVPKQDLAAAKKMLQDSGKAGFELDLLIFALGAFPEGKEVMEAVGGWWESIGIKVNRVPTDYDSFFTKWGAGSDFPKPSVSGVSIVANRPVTAGVAIGPFTKASGFRLSEDPEMETLSRAYASSTNMADYIKNGKILMQKVIEGSYLFGIAEVGETYAAKPEFVKEWKMGRGAYTVNIQTVATGKE